MELKDVVIIHHANCLDGFGGAFAAWKKFGDSASYIAANHGEAVPDGLDGKEIYIIDFSYPDGKLLEIESRAKKLVVLDHHIGAKESVEQVREHVFNNDRSGAGIAWHYFFPDAPFPRLLAYIDDNDLWRNSLPNNREVAAYCSTLPFDFKKWDALAAECEDDTKFAALIERGRAYAEYATYAREQIIKHAELVQFDEYQVLAVNAPRLLRSEIGHQLATKHAPFAIVYYEIDGAWHFSMRGDGSVDLSKIAQKHGGNGHRSAASFRLPFGSPFPFTLLQK
jgi:oligoribonuclease NrnB/cAMP/cGMP phosphodiesterase (DHH superfamily)